MKYEIINGNKKFKLPADSPLNPWEHKCGVCGDKTVPGNRIEVNVYDNGPKAEHQSTYSFFFCRKCGEDVIDTMMRLDTIVVSAGIEK